MCLHYGQTLFIYIPLKTSRCNLKSIVIVPLGGAAEKPKALKRRGGQSECIRRKRRHGKRPPLLIFLSPLYKLVFMAEAIFLKMPVWAYSAVVLNCIVFPGPMLRVPRGY
jgi:hypothetical protein